MSDQYYIYISDKPIGDGGGGTPSNPKKPATAKEKSGVFVSKYVALRVAESTMHSFEHSVSDNIQAIGYQQGDYVKMKKEQFANSIAQRIGNTALTAGVALATGHPAAAAVTVAVSIVNTGVSLYYDNKQAESENREANYTASQLSKRAGFSSSKSGSRGTED